MSETMLAVEYDRYGGPEVLTVREVPLVHAAAGQVRVRVVAAGLNPFDSKVRTGAGRYRDENPFPRGVGQDFAGVVDELGGDDLVLHDGSALAIGDEVIGWADRMSMREYVVVAPEHLVRKPAGLNWDVAGAIQTPARTAQTCVTLLSIGPDDTVLVGGAAGGVGGLVSQLAIARGARVIGTASAGNAAYLESIGVTPVTYGPGLEDRVRALGTITAAIDCHGREAVDAALALGVAPQRIHTIVMHDVTQELGLASPGMPERDAPTLAGVVAVVNDRRLVVPVRAFAVASVAEAFTLLEEGHVRGKLVVRF